MATAIPLLQTPMPKGARKIGVLRLHWHLRAAKDGTRRSPSANQFDFKGDGGRVYHAVKFRQMAPFHPCRRGSGLGATPEPAEVRHERLMFGIAAYAGIDWR